MLRTVMLRLSLKCTPVGNFPVIFSTLEFFVRSNQMAESMIVREVAMRLKFLTVTYSARLDIFSILCLRTRKLVSLGLKFIAYGVGISTEIDEPLFAVTCATVTK